MTDTDSDSLHYGAGVSQRTGFHSDINSNSFICAHVTFQCSPGSILCLVNLVPRLWSLRSHLTKDEEFTDQCESPGLIYLQRVEDLGNNMHKYLLSINHLCLILQEVWLQVKTRQVSEMIGRIEWLYSRKGTTGQGHSLSSMLLCIFNPSTPPHFSSTSKHFITA